MEPIKSREEIEAELREIIHRHRRKFIKRHSRPCAENCVYASETRKGVQGCRRCGSTDAEECKNTGRFVPMDTKSELAEQFAASLRNPAILQREYRDVLVLVWVLGGYDADGNAERVLARVEEHK